MALTSPIFESAEEVKEALYPLRNSISVALPRLGNPFAVGAILRVCHSFLVRDIMLIGQAPYYLKASMGMEKYETILEFDDEEHFLSHVARRPLICLEKELATHTIYDPDVFPEHAVLVFGSERFGVPKPLLHHAHRILSVPMYGVNQSFPVAVTCGMVLSEWARRRYGYAAKG